MGELSRGANHEDVLLLRDQAFQLSLDLMCVGTFSGKLLQVNPAWTACLGWSADELVGQPWLNFVYADDREATIHAGGNLARGIPVRDFENRYRHKDGSYRWLSWRTYPAVDALHVFGVARDITHQREQQQKQQQSSHLQRTAGRTARLGGWLVDLADNSLMWSDEVCAIHQVPSGFKPTLEQAIQFYVAEDRPVITRVVTECIEAGTPFDVELRIVTAHGQQRLVRAIGEAGRDEQGRIVHVQGAFQDVTDNRQVEASLRASEACLKQAQRIARLGSWDWNIVNDKVVWSEELFRLFGLTPGAFDGSYAAFLAGVHPDDRERAHQAVQDALAGVAPYHMEHRTLWPDGTVRVLLEQGEITRDAAGTPTHMAGTALDITERKQAETRLAETNRALHMLSRCNEVLVRSQDEGDLLAKVCRIVVEEGGFRLAWVGYAQHDDHKTIAMQAHACIDADVDAGYVSRIEATWSDTTPNGQGPAGRTIRSGEPVVVADVTTDASFAPWRQDALANGFLGAVSLPLTSGNDTFGVLGFYLSEVRTLHARELDVLRQLADDLAFGIANLRAQAERSRLALERQHAETQIREQAELLDKAQDAILVRDLDHRVLFWNKSAERRYGWSAEEVLGRSIQTLLCDDKAEFETATHATVTRGEWVGELHHRRKDGTPIVVEGRWTLVRDEAGQPKSILSVNTDLTERKKLERIEEQLRQAQKMEAVGNLAGGIAHDFNNLLSVILSYTEILIREAQPSDPLRADLEQVKRAGMRAADLTRQLLAFSRKQILEPVVLDPNQVVLGVEKMLGRLLGEDIELSFVTAPNVGRVHADAGQLEQVIMNLVVNARDAMPNGGNLTIETANIVLDETYAIDHAGVKPGAYVMLAVTDTGTGMDRATQERIFEPFFTTKEKSKGTGLGLSTVYGIVQQSGGSVWVYSELGQGTTFKVYLPRSDRALEAPSQSVLAPSSLRGTETILLVEDEDAVRHVMRTILRKQGYHVLEAQNGGEAFLVCEQFGATIHLMLTDVVMPRMSGRQLAERLAPLRPQMRVLYVSGYTENTIVHHGVLDAGIEFLAKPIMPDALLKKVRKVLDSRPSNSAPVM